MFKLDDIVVGIDLQPALEDVKLAVERFKCASEHMTFLLAGLGVTAEVSVKTGGGL